VPPNLWVSQASIAREGIPTVHVGLATKPSIPSEDAEWTEGDHLRRKCRR
jgi:hypothetical protein